MLLYSLQRWKAVVYKRFTGMHLADVKQMMGCFGAWPKDSPPKHVKHDIASEIPSSFDSRSKWPGSIHPIRDQVGKRMKLLHDNYDSRFCAGLKISVCKICQIFDNRFVVKAHLSRYGCKQLLSTKKV